MGRRITQESGYTRLYTVCDPDGNWFFYLTGLGLKRATYPLDNTNIYAVYPNLDSYTLQPDTVVKDISGIIGGKPLKPTYDPSLTDNKYFAESF